MKKSIGAKRGIVVNDIEMIKIEHSSIPESNHFVPTLT